MSKTETERMNELAGVDIFATRLDVCGAPLNGWSLPAFCLNDASGEVVFTCGSFRCTPDRQMQGVSVARRLKIGAYMMMDSEAGEQLRQEMFGELVEQIKVAK